MISSEAIDLERGEAARVGEQSVSAMVFSSRVTCAGVKLAWVESALASNKETSLVKVQSASLSELIKNNKMDLTDGFDKWIT